MRALVLALGLALVTAPGCATIVSKLPVVIAAVTDGMMVIDAIERFVAVVLEAKPDIAVANQVRDSIERARAALNAALRAAQGAEKLSQADIDRAFADFRAAYAALLELVGPLGVRQSGALQVVHGPGALGAAPVALEVPEPLALGLRVQ